MRTVDAMRLDFIHEMEQTSYPTKPAAELQIIKRDFEMNPPQTALKKMECSIERKPKQTPVWKDLLFLLLKIASIVRTFILLFTFLFGIVRYQELSMDPAIKDGDLVVFYRYNNSGYMPQDVIALKYDGKTQIGRVIATAGDTVDITEEGLVINGALQQELGIYQKTERYQEGVSFPLTVPEGEVFLLGDDRTNATDSRIYGCVKIQDTLAKIRITEAEDKNYMTLYKDSAGPGDTSKDTGYQTVGATARSFSFENTRNIPAPTGIMNDTGTLVARIAIAALIIASACVCTGLLKRKMFDK